MATRLHLDFETRSRTNLKTSGVHRYAEDPTTGVWRFSFRFDNGPVSRWEPGQPLPPRVVEHIREGKTVVAHNAGFERIIWNAILRKIFPDAPIMLIEQQSCTLARAAALGLPLDLDRLAGVMGLPHQKDMEGAAVNRKMSKPRRVLEDGTCIWWDDPELQARQAVYCDGDVYAEADVDHALPELPPREREIWKLDQIINERGVAVDLKMVTRAVELAAYAKKQADAEMYRLTGGAVPRCTEVQKIITWLNERGIPTTTLRKGDQDDIITLAEIYNDPTAKAVIELRRTASKTSVAKFGKFLDCACGDGRVRDLLAYHIAHTGRWGGRLVQPQNFPRVDAETEIAFVQFVAECLLSELPIAEVYELLETLGPPKSPIGEKQDGLSTLAWLSKSLRYTIIAPPDQKLVGGDFSNIEGRITAWLSGEEWKLEAFRAFDLGYGPDIYKLTYANSFAVPIETVTKPLRQIGKVQELALGFQGGVGAYLTMTQTYMVKLHMIVNAVYKAVEPGEWDKVRRSYEHARDRVVWSKITGRVELSEHEWTALKIVVRRWRNAHPNIVAGWWELQDAALRAVNEPHVIVPAYSGRVRYLSDGGYLFCQLPSGRCIAYASPSIQGERTEQIWNGVEWLDCARLTLEQIAALETLGFKVKRQTRYHVSFWTLDDSNQWRPSALYGGYQCENIVQGTARCVLDRAMTRAEDNGYPLVLTVHDELLAQVPRAFGSAEHFAELMQVPEPWMQGLPVAAAAWEGQRYEK